MLYGKRNFLYTFVCVVGFRIDRGLYDSGFESFRSVRRIVRCSQVQIKSNRSTYSWFLVVSSRAQQFTSQLINYKVYVIDLFFTIL